MPGTFPVLSTGAAFRYPVDRTIHTRSIVHRFCDFSEQRYQRSGTLKPLDFAFTWSSISTADKNLIRDFYGLQNGEEACDWAMVFDRTLYTSCQFVGEFRPQYINTNLWSVTLRVRTISGTASASGPIQQPVTTLPPGTTVGISVTSAVTSVPGTIYQLPSFQMSSDGGTSYGGTASLIYAGWLGINWSEKTDLVTGGFSYSPGLLRVAIGFNTISAFMTQQSGTISTIKIYDIRLLATLPDGSTQILKPLVTITTPQNANSGNYAQDIGAAVDDDPTTFALINSDMTTFLTGQVPGLLFTW